MSLGTIAGSDRMGVAHDNTNTLLCSTIGSYQVTASGLTAVSDGDMPKGNKVAYHNGYFAKPVENSNEFAVSEIDDPLGS